MPRAYIALGANVGAPPQALSIMCHRLARTHNVVLERTSALYVSKPATRPLDAVYANAVARVRTSLPPAQLLHECKRIEVEMGRDLGAPRHAPREADLDVLLYGPHVTVDTPTLQLPHAAMMERDFVLRPLLEVLHDDDATAWRASLTSALVRAPRLITGQLCTFGTHAFDPIAGPAQLLGVINVTPDSFSDGGLHFEPERAAERAAALARDGGVAFFDVGGESTRPHAMSVAADDELRRVVPAIEAIAKRCPEARISVDTSKAVVAEAALRAGATCVNDVTAGMADGALLSVVARSPLASVVLMHSRGGPATMDALAVYPPGGELDAVVAELLPRVDAAMQAGIPRWRIAVDPGLGFAKKSEHSLALLGCANELRARLGGGVGVVVGASRKRFVRTAMSKGDDVDVASAAAAAVAAASGADFIRAHEASAHRAALSVGNALKKMHARGHMNFV